MSLHAKDLPQGTYMNAQDKGQQVKPVVQTYHRLSTSQYQELEKQALAGHRFRDDTQPVQSGFLNGVEHTLRILRQGFTVA